MKLAEYYKEKDYIHYSNCHEDFLLLNKYFSNEHKTVLSVASGLDNSLAFLVHDGVKVFAFDYNPSQVYLGKLKKCAIEHFTYKQFLIFMGIEKGDRSALYNELSPVLEKDVKDQEKELELIREMNKNV